MKDVEQKNLAIEGLRGIASLFVVFNHLPFAANALGPNRTAQFGITSWWINTAAHFGAFGVQLFFCITGYLFWQKVVLSGKTTHWSTFYRNRVLRLTPAFMAAAVVIMLCGFKLSAWRINVPLGMLGHDIYAMLSFGLLQQSDFNGVDVTYFNAVTWTLAYEWKFYVLLPLAVALHHYSPLRWMGIVALLAYAFIYNQNAFPVIFFLSGALIATFERKTLSPVLGTVLFLLLSALYVGTPHDGIIPFLNQATGSTTIAQGTHILILWIMTSATFLVAVKYSPSLLTARWTMALGTISYSLYLFHLVVLQSTIRLLQKYKPLDSWTTGTFLAWASVALVLSLAVSCISYALVEKPFLQRKRPERSDAGLPQSEKSEAVS